MIQHALLKFVRLFRYTVYKRRHLFPINDIQSDIYEYILHFTYMQCIYLLIPYLYSGPGSFFKDKPCTSMLNENTLGI